MSFDRTQEKESYLILSVNEKYDRTNKVSYFYISADPYNDYAKEIYDLVTFNQEPYVNGSGTHNLRFSTQKEKGSFHYTR